MKRGKTEFVKVVVTVKMNYDNDPRKKCRKKAIAAIKEHLQVHFHSSGDGFFSINSGSVKIKGKPITIIS